MARKREIEKPVEDDSESGEEDDSSSEDGSSEESDSEPDLTQFTKKPSSSTPAAAKKPKSESASKPKQLPHSSLPVEEESGSESESDSDGPDPKLKSISIKSKEEPQRSINGARKSRSKSSAADPVTPTKPAGVKRSSEEMATVGKDAKKSKKKDEPEASEKKPTTDRVLFQRLWSEEDEIAILKGMIDYSAKKNSDPLADINTFHDFIKKNLHIVVTNTQLQDKIRRLKKKYENNRSKEKDGKEKTFPKPHEKKTYELSKSIWGNENLKENRIEKVAEKVVDVDMKSDMKSVFPMKAAESIGVATVDERILMIGDELFEDGKGDSEWNKMKMEEMEIYLRHLELKTAQARIVVEHMKSKGKYKV